MAFLPEAGRRRAVVAAVAAFAVAVMVAVGVWALTDDDDGAAVAADDRSSDSAPPVDADLPTTRPAPTTTTSAPTSTSDTSAPSSIAPATTGQPTTTVGPSTTAAPAVPAIALRRAVDLPSPSAVAHLGDGGSILVSTLDGRVHRVDLDAGTARVVLDLTGVVSTGGERGLLGLAVDADARRMYVNYTNRAGDTEIRSWPLQGRAPVGGASDGVLHLEIGQPYANHNGGNLVFGPDGMLWIGTGDGGRSGDPDEVAQDPSSLRGKMLRVMPDPAGGVLAPSSNPDWGGRPEVWGIGLRNPWRYSFDRATNLLWIADVGQNVMEEVSVISPGALRPNFGWDDVEGTRDFEGTQQPGFTRPVITYRHDQGCSVTGGHVYRGQDIPALFGWYLFGDFCGGWIRAVPADDPGRRPVELIGDAGGAVSFGELADGELVFLTAGGIDRIVAR